MGRIVVINHLTLDGVMQAPGRPDEDTRDGFDRGGWATSYADPAMVEVSSREGATAGGLLLGRRTYLDFYGVWPGRTDNPYSDVLNRSTKYIASRTLEDPLPWENSVLLEGDAGEAVAALKPTLEKNLTVLGSGELVT